MIEAEVKLPVRDLEEVKKQLIQKGFVPLSHIQEKDVYFDDAQGQIRANGQALRIRKTMDMKTGSTAGQINFKGKKIDTLTMTRQELESIVDKADICIQILEAVGFHKVFPKVIKDRTMLQYGEMTACLDQVEGLGDFLELEILVDREEQKDAAQERIASVLETLGYSMADTVRRSYLSMLQEKQEKSELSERLL